VSIAENMLDGSQCSHCCVFFKEAHGHPVLCHDCYDHETKEERAGLLRASIKEFFER